MAFKFLDEVSQDFSELLNDKKEYNVIIENIYSGNVNIENTDTKSIYELITHFSFVYHSIQNPTLPSDPEEWSKENIKALKITLHQCLPLIRYFHIPSEVILEKVEPYKKILEKQLWDDIILHSISPNKAVISLILLINRKSTIYSLADIPYEFQLILRGSRDDFHPKTFWKMCHGHAGTIVVAKVSGLMK
ncbi:hypothetical protein Glove_151g11 [Diversispora epigaea]|uniref:TLDc domain-containing protein n=1 Tax=Diversispora epigaea TaxID=1348612 RepID=A0A397J1Q1_9GLOM|nr:hypothetical protein Glove_151g11 [Diversispora epigaea]